MRFVPLCALAVALIVTLSCTIAPEASKTGWSGATGGEQYERLFWDSVKAKNWRDVEAHLSRTFVFQDAEGVRNKQQAMDDYFHPMNVVDYSLGDVKTETSGADLVVTYTITLRGTFDGQSLPDRSFRMMSVWQQVTKGMIMTAHAITTSS